MHAARPLHFMTTLLLAGVLALSACAPKTGTTTLPAEVPDAFAQTGEQELPEKWWTALGDTVLNQVMDTALTQNFDLVVAWQRLQAAQAVVDRESAALLPDLGANMQGGASFPQPDFVGGENVRLSLSSQYEVDLWGRIHALVDAERFRRRASLADYQTAAISLTAEVARTWFQLAEANRQQDLLTVQVETNERILQLLRRRLGIGQVQSVDVLRQEQLLASTREQLNYVEADLQVLQNQLAVLSGFSPRQALPVVPDRLVELPALPATGLPLELVRRRPDLQQAFFRVKAADKELAAAISNKYPRLSLSASTSLRSNNVDDIFKNWAYSLGANIAAPLLNAGRLRAEVDRSRAVRAQRLYEYGQAVLTAFREVEDALALETQQQQALANVNTQLDYARRAYEQLRMQYFNGGSTYLDVLTALRQQQQLQRDLISARYLLLEYRIGLYRALAGPIDAPNEALNK